MAAKKEEKKLYKLITLRGKSGFLKLNKPQQYDKDSKPMFSAQVLYYNAEDGEKQKDASLAKLKEAWIEAAKLRDIDVNGPEFTNGLNKSLSDRNKIKKEIPDDPVKGGKYAQGFSSPVRPRIVANGANIDATEQCPWFLYGGDIEVVLRCSVFESKNYGTICKAELAGVCIKGEIKERNQEEYTDTPVPQEDIDALFSS